jgi:hypothetical protein
VRLFSHVPPNLGRHQRNASSKGSDNNRNIDFNQKPLPPSPLIVLPTRNPLRTDHSIDLILRPFLPADPCDVKPITLIFDDFDDRVATIKAAITPQVWYIAHKFKMDLVYVACLPLQSLEQPDIETNATILASFSRQGHAIPGVISAGMYRKFLWAKHWENHADFVPEGFKRGYSRLLGKISQDSIIFTCLSRDLHRNLNFNFDSLLKEAEKLIIPLGINTDD